MFDSTTALLVLTTVSIFYSAWVARCPLNYSGRKEGMEATAVAVMFTFIYVRELTIKISYTSTVVVASNKVRFVK